MFVLIWSTLLFSVRVSDAETGYSAWGPTSCSYGFCNTLVEGDITAEVGLCVVIPCSFTIPYSFRLSTLVWSKCESTKPRCGDVDMIFNSRGSSRKVQVGFTGRVSLLESDVSQKNCSIIISDLKESDSGTYQLRVNGHFNGYADGFTFPQRTTVHVKGLSQKPTVTIPPLTEGRPATLTCTAPGLCSGSEPTITWTWRGRGESDAHIPGSITALMTENVAAFAKRSRSNLTFDPSAEHHGGNITCTVNFRGNVITEETKTLSVTYVKEVRITRNTSVKEGETLNLTCSVESFPPSMITWTKDFDQNIRNGTETTLQNDTFSNLLNDTEERGTATLAISNATPEDSGQYICTLTHRNNTWKESVNVTVIYMRDPVITGDSKVKGEDVLNLTCSVDSFPPSLVVWTKLGFNTNLHNGSVLQNDSGSSTLIIPDVTAEHSGHYICTAQHPDRIATTFTDVTVTWFSKILKNSGCEVQSGVLTCVCISEGFPLPAIKWPLLKDHTAYSIITTVSNYTVSSTVILKGRSNSSVECVSDNENGEAKEKLITRINSSELGDEPKVFKRFSWLEAIIAFFLGVLLSAVVFLLAKQCQRKKQKSTDYLDETLEMATNQEDPLIHNGQAARDAQTHGQERAEAGSVAAETRAPDLDGGPDDVDYASIDFSLLKRRSARDGAKKPETTETEYAEIKKQVEEEREDGGAEEGEVLEEARIGEEEETNHCVPEEEEGEDMAVYANIKDVMAEI
ncbi:myelin-associated glycoprotein-like isoform X1 [Paralichthys olivaceus]|uniref:myelin-associated glycoprotein-like isoform X1 n=1 Tax=Paralichthys olivaceus TaxID=8255 RepID=UPI003752AFAE